MINRISFFWPALGVLVLGGCQTAPTASSGFLTSYEGLSAPGSSLRAAVTQRRDDQVSDTIDRVFITPAIFLEGVGESLSPTDRYALLSEVDRQTCFEISERFTVVPAADPETAVIRTAIVRIDTTNPVASGLSAAVGVVNPLPLNFRVPGMIGGIAIESEMLTPPPREQIAAIAWGRNANALGSDSPSLSRIGDAHQFAEPMGDAVGDAFATEAREVRKISDPDPCAAYGSRRNLRGALIDMATGLHVPETRQDRAPQ